MRTNGRDTIDLSGTWNLQLDPRDEGLEGRWWESFPGESGPGESPRSSEEGGPVTLPGAIHAQGYGEPPGPETEWTVSDIDASFRDDPHLGDLYRDDTFRMPYLLQPDRCYVGAAWFTREVELPGSLGNLGSPDSPGSPESPQGNVLILRLERAHWTTAVWWDGEALGSRDSLSVPHEYTIGTLGAAGGGDGGGDSRGIAPGKHRITVRVDNRLLHNVGPNAHSVSDHTQGNWNGIIGRIELAAVHPVYIQELSVFPSVERRTAVLRVSIGNATGREVEMTTAISGRDIHDCGEKTPIRVPPEGITVHRELRFSPALRPWDEFSPVLTSVNLTLGGIVGGCDGGTSGGPGGVGGIPGGPKGRAITETAALRFGLREIEVKNSRIHLNGRPISLRGTLECCVFPRNGHPPTDTESWRRVYRRAREYGLNHIRFHSWCPPEAAFDAADEAGIYLQVECPVWANQGAVVGIDPALDQWLYRESERIVAAYGNHPSFVMFCPGNEPAGRIDEFLGQWVSYWKQRDRRRLYTAGAGWPAIPENDFHNVHEPRVQGWGEGLDSRINALPPETTTDYREICAPLTEGGAAVVSHEIGQWCAFPNFDEIPKYTGALKARNFELFRELLEKRGMGAQARQFLEASGRLQVLCYREEIESALRTPNMSGFQLLGLTDFPGQGTALVGVLDPFWDDKGYCPPEVFRESCGPTVLLARLPRRYYHPGERLEAAVDISHFGAEAWKGVEAEWSLTAEDGAIVASGNLGAPRDVGIGLSELGRISLEIDLPEVPARCELSIALPDRGIRNRWALWVFPKNPDTGAEDSAGRAAVHIAENLDETAAGILDSGSRVLLLPRAESVISDVEIGFSSMFWNTAWTDGQAPHTLGILCDPDHPVFSRFPTDDHSDWQWWELMHRSAAMVLDDLPGELKALVQPIDTWFRSHKLGLLFEASIGRGKLMVCSIDLRSRLENRPVARQFRASLLAYTRGEGFSPKTGLALEDLRGLFK